MTGFVSRPWEGSVVRTQMVSVLVAGGLLAACSGHATSRTDAVASALCPLATAKITSDGDVKDLATRAAQAQKDVLAKSFDSKYRPLTAAVGLVQGGAEGLAHLNAQIPVNLRSRGQAAQEYARFQGALSRGRDAISSACATLRRS